MEKRLQGTWIVAVAAVVGIGGGALGACGGAEGGGDVTSNRELDPGAFLVQLETSLCNGAAACAGGGTPALAGCGFAVSFADPAACAGGDAAACAQAQQAACVAWVRERAVGLSAAFASGDLCFWGAPRGFAGTTPAGACIAALNGIQTGAAACVAPEAATSACEGVLAPGGGGTGGSAGTGGSGGSGGEEGSAGSGGSGVGGSGGTTGSGLQNAALALPLECRCVLLPVGPVPPECQAVLGATELAARTDVVGNGTVCGESNCADCADDDGNGATDCGDRTCAGTAACAARPPTETICTGGLDEDGDCQADCVDPDCASAIECGGTGGTVGGGGTGGLGGAGGEAGSGGTGGAGGSGGEAGAGGARGEAGSGGTGGTAP